MSRVLRFPSAPAAAGLWPLLRRSLAFARPHRRALAVGTLLTLAGGGLAALEPLLLKLVFDGLAGGSAVRGVAAGLGGLIALAVLREAATGLANTVTWRTRLRITHDLLGSSIGRLHRLPLAHQRREGVGAVMTRLQRGIDGFVRALSEILFNLLPAVAYLALAIGIMARLDWRLLLVVLLFVPLPGVIAAAAAPRQMQREKTLLEGWVRIYSRFNEVLAGIVTVRSFAREDDERRRFLDEVGDANEVVARGVRFDSGVGAAQNLAIAAARVAGLAFGAHLVAAGEVSVGTLVAFLGYAAGVFGPVQGLTGIYRTLVTGAVSLEQVFAILDSRADLDDSPSAHALSRVRGEISFENVHFSYGPGVATLRGVDLRVAPGEVVALVGPSGSGKSTLMALLQRFHDPDRGVVRIDGHDLRELEQKSIRRNIAVVLQDPVLWNDTVYANLAYGRPEASREEVRRAAEAVQAGRFVERLPEGYDTVIGERGALLSVGERQRLAIGRALLKDAPILVLDEATSSLDAESEALVQAALDRVLEGRTAIVIAHRLSTVVRADRIVVLREGRIVEQGTHAELLAQRGYYSELVEHQIRGLLPERLAAAL